MAAGSSPPQLYSPAQPQYLTISSFTPNSIGLTTLHLCNFFIRSLMLLLSFVYATLLVASDAHRKKDDEVMFRFFQYPELRYSFGITILAAIYSAFQLYKFVFDIVHRSLFISDLVSDYLSFILDQPLCYLLISSSSVSVLAVLRIESGSPAWKAIIVSVSMSFAAFLVFIACSLLSGYKLCKRIIW